MFNSYCPPRQLQVPIRNEPDEIYYRYLKGIRYYGQLMWDYDPGNITRMNKRDSLMSQNLIWQIDNLYRDKKIIVQLANVHLFYAPLGEGSNRFIPLGKYIKDRYQDASYMMGFTSYAQKKVLNIFMTRQEPIRLNIYCIRKITNMHILI